MNTDSNAFGSSPKLCCWCGKVPVSFSEECCSEECQDHLQGERDAETASHDPWDY